jgi:hypothetical protein
VDKHGPQNDTNERIRAGTKVEKGWKVGIESLVEGKESNVFLSVNSGN